MKKGNPVPGYALLAVLVVLLGLVIATAARDIRGAGDTVQLAEPDVEEDEKKDEKPPAQPKQKQGRIWEGTM